MKTLVLQVENILNIDLNNAKPPLVYIIILVFTCLLYRNILSTYAYTDAYEFILNASNSKFIDVFIQHGRLLYGASSKILFSYFNSIEDVKFIRLIALLGGVLYSFCLFKILLENKLSFKFSLLTILLFTTTPSFNIIIVWSATYQVSWGMLFSLIAGFIAVRYQTRKTYFLFSILLGLIALNLYQPSYTMFIIPSFLCWISTTQVKSLFRPVLIHVTTYALYFLIYKVYLGAFDLVPIGRSGIEYNIFQSISWFITGPLEQSLSFNFIFAPKFWLYLTRVLLLLIIVISTIRVKNKDLLKGVKKSLFRLAITGIFFVLSMLPNILSIDKWVSYRTMNTLCLLTVIHIALFLTCQYASLNKYLVSILIYCFLGLALFATDYNIDKGFISIQKTELGSLASALSEDISDTTQIIFYKKPDIDILVKNDLVERVITDEFGRLSSSSDWVPQPMIKLLLPESSRKVISHTDEKYNMNVRLIDIGKEYLKHVDSNE